jgi:hypothetical protein
MHGVAAPCIVTLIRMLLKMRWVALVLVATACALGNTAARAPHVHLPNQTTGTPSISGTVVASATGQPLVDAEVSISGPGIRTTVRSGSAGRFTFGRLVPGRYIVSAIKTGFLSVRHGERKPQGAGRPITLAAGERRDIRLSLPLLSAIAGQVVNDRGEPLINARVSARRYTWVYGDRRSRIAGYSQTDDRGFFRIHSLQPGEYAVCAWTTQTAPLSPSQRLQLEAFAQERRTRFVAGPEWVKAQKDAEAYLAGSRAKVPERVEPVIGYAPACIPSSGSNLETIVLAPGDERSNVDLRLTFTRLARIEGIVTGRPSLETQTDVIGLSSADDLFELETVSDPTRHDLEGRFRFWNVPPGRYRVFIRGVRGVENGTPDTKLTASADVVVADDDIENVVLALQPGARVSGQVFLEGTARESGRARARTQVQMYRVEPWGESIHSTVRITDADADGRFVLENVIPGAYRFAATMDVPAVWFVDSAVLSGQDVLDQSVVIKSGEDIGGLVVRMTNRRAALSGTILDERGDPAAGYVILVYPTDEKYWTNTSRRMLLAWPTPDGRFTVQGIQAGEYRLAMLLDPESGAWWDPAFLRGLESTSTRLSFADGEKKVLNLRVPADDIRVP